MRQKITEKDLDWLLTAPLFQGIENKKDLAWVLKCVDGEIREYRAGDAIFEENETVDVAGMTVSGVLHLEAGEKTTDIRPQEMIPIPGGAEHPAKAPGRVTAREDSRVLFMKWMRLMKICNFNCAFHKQLLENLKSLMD